MTFQVGDWVLVNPHSLEWVESKGEGSKLVQRWIGLFEILQRVGEDTYRLRLGDNYPGNPVFNLQHLKRYLDTIHTLNRGNVTSASFVHLQF